MKLILYGASGHGKVIADVVKCQGRFTVVGFIDDDPAKTGCLIGKIPVLGTAKVIPDLLSEGVQLAIVSIGVNKIRMDKAGDLERLGFQLATAIHPTAVIASDVFIGEGTVIMPGVVINPGTVIGRNVIINTGATIEHDCVIEDGVHISPGAKLAGGVTVGHATHVGIGATVIQQIQIGAEAIVGAGAVVIRDVPAGVTVVGNPARLLKEGQ